MAPEEPSILELTHLSWGWWHSSLWHCRERTGSGVVPGIIHPSFFTMLIQVGYKEKLLLRKSSKALEQAAQRGDRVTIPGGVYENGRCGT